MTWVGAPPPPRTWSILYEWWDGDTYEYDAPVTWIVPFLLILCFPLFRLHVFFPYFDLSFHAFSSSVFSSCFFGDFNITLLQFFLHHVCLFSRVTLMRRILLSFLCMFPVWIWILDFVWMFYGNDWRIVPWVTFGLVPPGSRGEL